MSNFKSMALALVAGLLAACSGGASAPGQSITAPGAPVGVAVTADVRSATVTWSVPASDGGSPITSYTVTASPGGATRAVSGTSARVDGLENGTAYTFSVVASNAAGTGPASGPSVAITTPDLPGSPTRLTATPGDGQATIAWSSPVNDGGRPITDYTVVTSPTEPGAAVSVIGTSATVTGLVNGRSYTFQIAARNAVGDGAPSGASSPVIPRLAAWLAAGRHWLSLAVTPAADAPLAVSGISIAVALPPGTSVATVDAASTQVAPTSLEPGAALSTVRVLAGAWSAATGQVRLALATTPPTSWRGEYLRLAVDVGDLAQVTAADLSAAVGSPVEYKVVGYDEPAHATTLLTAKAPTTLQGVSP